MMSKSQFLKAVVAVLAAVPVAAAGVFTSASSAEAAVLKGQAGYSGIGSGIFSPVTTILASDGSITFSSPNLVGLGAQTGSFTAFSAAKISDISPIPGTFDPAKLLLDFGANLAGLTDGKNVFKATSVSDYVIASDGGTGSSIALAFKGYFLGENETEKSSGSVNLNFTSVQSVAAVESILLAGGTGTIESTFSGMTVAAVPEPTTMLGLGLVAAGMTVARRRKAVNA
jgi:hypothetical protein